VNQGLGGAVTGLAMRYYFKDVLGLQSNPALMQNLRTAARIPWNIKPVMGMVSDAYPLFGFHRTSYMAVASLGGVVGFASLGTLPLSAIATLPFSLLVSFSTATPDVMIDAFAAKLSKEAPASASDLQSLVFGSLPFGMALSCAISGTLVQSLGPKFLLLLVALCPLCVFVPSVLRWLPEARVPRKHRKLDLSFLKKHGPVTALAACMSVLSVTLSVLQVLVGSVHIRGPVILVCAAILAVSVYFSLHRITPILAKVALFIFVRECLQPSIGDPMFLWYTTAEGGPLFSPQVMGALEGVGAVGLFCGVVIYNEFLTGVSYRRIFLMAQLAIALYNLSDYILVKRWNLSIGIPDIVFILGDDAFGVLVGRFFMMPMLVLSSRVCPDKLEGTLFAMLMALSNFGSTVGEFFGATMAGVLSIKNGNFDMLPHAVIAKSICRLLPIPLIYILVPNLTPQDPIPGVEGEGDSAEVALEGTCRARSAAAGMCMEDVDSEAGNPERGYENPSAERTRTDRTSACA